MASSLISSGANLAGSQILGRTLAMMVGTQAARTFLSRIDGKRLSPFEHRTITGRWMGPLGGHVAELAVGAAGLATIVREVKSVAPQSRHIDWVEVLQRTATILVAVGAIVRVIAGLIEDRTRTADEHRNWSNR